MNKATCYIFAAGDFNGSFSKNDGDLIIAADSGYRHLEKLGVTPDILIGDFDTIDMMPDIEDTIRFPIEKDYTDSALAIDEAINRGYTDITLFGAVGGKRLEHTLANLQLLIKYTKKGINIRLSDGINNIIALCNSSISFSENHQGFISIFSHGDKAIGVTVSGLKYTLNNAVLSNDEPLGISNEFIGKKSTVSVKDGTLIIMYKPYPEENINED